MSLKQIKRRIGSVTSTQQITRAMKMVAAARLRHAQENIIKARPYSLKLRQVIRELAARTDRSIHPLLDERPAKNVAIVVVTGDRGLCGSFNTNIIREAQKVMEEERGAKVSLITVGRKATDFFGRRNFDIAESLSNFFNELHFSHAAKLGQLIVQGYQQQGLDRVYLVYNEFKSAIQQFVIREQLLPIMPDEFEAGESHTDFIFEPSEKQILSAILPQYVNIQLWRVLLESYAAEMGARMTAMENATESAAELIDMLTLHYNKARQAAITKELLEVVSGAESLK
ncbi:ATP synthase F1 subunit gamma [bacterium]|nr:ATP synthase F1 subunit gamma [bacterium]